MSEIVFLVEEDPEGGYSAKSMGEAIFTEGDTEEELKGNIKDALRCHFDTEAEIPPIIRLHFVRDQIIAYA